MLNNIAKFLRDEEGASAVEYGLIVGLIAVVLIAALVAVGGADEASGLRGLFNQVADELPTPAPAN